MKSLTVQLDEDMFREVKIKTAKLGISLREYITQLILADLEQDKEKSDT